MRSASSPAARARAFLRDQRTHAEARHADAVKEHQRERGAWVKRLDKLDDQVGELTRVLALITEPVAGLPPDIDHVGDRVELTVKELRSELSEQRVADQKIYAESVSTPLAQVRSMLEQLEN